LDRAFDLGGASAALPPPLHLCSIPWAVGLFVCWDLLLGFSKTFGYLAVFFGVILYRIILGWVAG
jgi:hypothetical protein